MHENFIDYKSFRKSLFFAEIAAVIFEAFKRNNKELELALFMSFRRRKEKKLSIQERNIKKERENYSN